MDLHELRRTMELEGLRIDAVVTVLREWRPPNEQFVIAQRRDSWIVYYAERGLETGIRQFPTENDACWYLLNLLRSNRDEWIDVDNAQN